MAHRRRKDLAAIRRRVEDEGDEEGALDAADLDDDSLSEGSITTYDGEGHEGDEASRAEAASALLASSPSCPSPSYVVIDPSLNESSSKSAASRAPSSSPSSSTRLRIAARSFLRR